MGKVLKILTSPLSLISKDLDTAVKSVFFIAAGVMTGNPGLIMAGVSMGASLLTKPKQTKMSSATADRLNVSLNVRTPRVMAFGSTALGTDLRDQEFTGANKEYLHRFIVNAAHRLSAIREIWFDDQIAWTLAGGVQGQYAGYLTVQTILEGSPANAINISARMGSSRRYTGCAYTYLRFKLTGNTSKTESPFSQQVPTRITIVGDGVPIYDPRQDDTQPGGAGSHRADDQSTWTWGEHARNPACQLGTWLLGWRIQNPQSGTWKLSVGCGVPADRINWPSIIEGANLCDEPIALVGGGTQPRYLSDGLFNEQDDRPGVVESFKATMNADLDDQDGLLRLTVFHNDLATPDADLGTGDLLDDYVWVQTPPLTESFDVVRGTYIEPASLYQPADYDEAAVASPDGIERVHNADFGLVQSKAQAERLAKQRAQRQQYGGTFRGTFLSPAWKVQKNSVLRFTFAPEGWTNKLFRVVETEVRQDGLVPMLLREEHPAIYAWDAEEGPAVQIAEPTEYAPGEAPIAQVLGEFEALKPAAPGATPGAPAGTDIGGVLDPVTGAQTGGVPAVQVISRIAAAETTIAAHSVADQAAEATARQLRESSEELAEALVRALTQVNTQRVQMRDAGIVVDPATGQVRLYGLDRMGERVSSAEVRLDGVDAQISLRATTTYVNSAIAAAVLDSSDLAALDEIYTRIGAAELDIDGLQAAIILKADATTVTALSGTVTSLSTTLDALAGTVDTKASSATVTAIDARVSTVETTLGTLGDVVGIRTEIRQARYVNDQQAQSLLDALVAGDAARRSALAQLAVVQNELTTKIVDDVSAEAAARLALAVRMSAAEAGVISEQLARITADGVLASSISSLTTTVGGHTSTLTAYGLSIDGLRAKAGLRVNIDGRITGWELNSGADSGELDVLVDAFRLTDPDTGLPYLEASASGMRLDGSLDMGDGKIVSAAGGFRKLDGAGVGSAANLVLWFGPDSVAEGSETIANSVFALATDGVVYYGGSTLPTTGGAAAPQSATISGTTALTAYALISSVRLAVAPGTLHFGGTANLSSTSPGGGDVRFDLVDHNGTATVLHTEPLSAGIDEDYDFSAIAPISTGIASPQVWTFNVYARRTGGFGDVSVAGDLIWHM